MSKQRRISKEAIKKLNEHVNNLMIISSVFNFLEKKCEHEGDYEWQGLLHILSEYIQTDKKNFVSYFFNHGFIE